MSKTVKKAKVSKKAPKKVVKKPVKKTSKKKPFKVTAGFKKMKATRLESDKKIQVEVDKEDLIGETLIEQGMQSEQELGFDDPEADGFLDENDELEFSPEEGEDE
jgi:hypothetical protein